MKPLSVEDGTACRWCGKKIRLLRYGHAYQWTHDDMSGRECCKKIAEPEPNGMSDEQVARTEWHITYRDSVFAENPIEAVRVAAKAISDDPELLGLYAIVTAQPAVPVEERTAEMEPRWECFSDSSYFDMWCVRKVGETRFGFGYHVPSEAEARALCDELSGHIEGKAKAEEVQE